MVSTADTDGNAQPPAATLTARAAAGAVGRASLIAIPVGVALFALFLALAYASLGADRERLAGQVRAAFAAEDIRPGRSSIFGDTDLGVHQYNDCLILFQAIDDRAPRLQRAVSPLAPPLGPVIPCLRLRSLVTTGADGLPRFYHQYLHAHTTLARALVPAFGVRGTRELYKLVISLTLLAGIGYAVLDLARGRGGRRGRAVNAASLVLFLAFARMFGFEGFGQSLGHAPADLLLIGYLLFASRAAAAGALTARGAVVSAAVFGALTMEFEFLTGGLPLGLALVVALTPLALMQPRDLAAGVSGSAAAFVGAAVTVAVSKLAVVAALFGSAPLVDAGRQLLFRTGLDHGATRGPPAGYGDFFGTVYAGLDVLAPGMHWLALGLLLGAMVASGWGYRRLRDGDDPLARGWVTALVGSNLVILLWMVVFWEHTAGHAWFMDRLLVWPIASGAAVFVLALLQRAPEAS